MMTIGLAEPVTKASVDRLRSRRLHLRSASIVLASVLLVGPGASTADADSAVYRWYRSWQDTMREGLDSRCQTALCFGGRNKHFMGAEVLLDLPVGKTFHLKGRELQAGHGSDDIVRRAVEGDQVSFGFVAGARLWFLDDLASVGVLLLQGSFSSDIQTVDKTFPASSLRSTSVGWTIGVLGDVVMVNLVKYRFRNDSSPIGNVPAYAPLSEGWLVTVAIAPFTLFRNRGRSEAK